MCDVLGDGERGRPLAKDLDLMRLPVLERAAPLMDVAIAHALSRTRSWLSMR